MRYINNQSQDEQQSFGPGTDLIISLVAVLMVLMAVLQIDLSEANKKLKTYEDAARKHERMLLKINNE
ncbi:MAG: hypothetical protein AAFO69_09910, partial [Bacteroidota bacterium]